MTGRAVLRGAVAGQRRGVGIACVLGAVHQAGEASMPILIGVVVDRAVARDDAGALVLWTVVLGLVYLALSFGFRFGARAGEQAAERAAHDLRLRVVERVVDPVGGADSGRLPGALVNVATEDAKRVGAVNMAVMLGFAGLTGLLVGAIALLRISVPLGLVVVLGAPPLLWLGHVVGAPLERRSATEQERAAHASGVAADLLGGLRVLKGIGGEAAAIERYRRTSRDSLAATLRAARAQAGQSGVVVALSGAFIAIVAWYGGRLAAQGDISLGELVAAVGLAQFLFGPLQVFAWVNAEFAAGRASAARLADVLGAPPALPPGQYTPPDPAEGRLALAGVSHGPLHDIEFAVRPGELLAVAAVDPADASALLRCLARDADPEAGTITLDGRPLADLAPAALRAGILVAAHNAALFEGTLAENIAVARPDGAPGAVSLEEAMAASAADDVAAALPDGEHGMVTERGGSLSGGQRQRVALARALAADPPVLVLHDPTTAVDAVTEARIAERLGHLRRKRTTVVVTTSPGLLAAADRVVLLAGGRIVDTATHGELAARHEAYRTAVLV